MIKVTHFHRRPVGSFFSIERLFNAIRQALPQDVSVRVEVCRYPSNGVFKRIYNILEAVFRQGDINHITGDVYYLALLLKKRQTIVTIHDFVSLHRLAGFRRLLFYIFWYWMPIKSAGAVVTISESTKRELLRFVKVEPSRVHVIHDCIPEGFIPSRRAFRSSASVVLQVGTGPNKNLLRVARALKGLKVHYRIIGALSLEQKIAMEVCGVDYSSVSGISDAAIIAEYENCDMLVFASTYEGFGMPILEAQSVGRPVVTSSIHSMPEVAGDAACLVDPFDEQSIRSGIIKILEDPEYRERLVDRGFLNVKRFTQDEIARQYSELYHEMLTHP